MARRTPQARVRGPCRPPSDGTSMSAIRAGALSSTSSATVAPRRACSNSITSTAGRGRIRMIRIASGSAAHAHNQHAAEQLYGRDFMERARRPRGTRVAPGRDAMRHRRLCMELVLTKARVADRSDRLRRSESSESRRPLPHLRRINSTPPPSAASAATPRPSRSGTRSPRGGPRSSRRTPSCRRGRGQRG